MWPVEAAEGKLFKPLAFTKTFALIASVIVALVVIPAFARFFIRQRKRITEESKARRIIRISATAIAVVFVGVVLTKHWLPLGPEKGFTRNFLFAGLLIGGLLLFVQLFIKAYPAMLRWCLDHKALALIAPLMVVLFGGMTWLGFDAFFGWLPGPLVRTAPVSRLAHAFPGLGKEFMPPLDEGSYLLMPTTMPHASIGEVMDVLSKQDMAISAIPEVSMAVGKLGRVESPLDPAPVSMIETVINYHSQYIQDESGRRKKFSWDGNEDDHFRNEAGDPVAALDGEPYIIKGTFLRDESGHLTPDEDGRPFRLWRPPLDPDLNDGRKAWGGIEEPDQIWDEIVKAAEVPGTTSAPRLQPIAARIVMLQSGMRAPMGMKVKGPSLETIDNVGLQLEKLLKEVPSIEPAAVFADRIVGKPYLEIDIDRLAIARYGIMLQDVQDVIEIAVGGKQISTTVEGRERYPIRVRYLRELRDSIESLGGILVPAADGAQIPLSQLAKINYVRGPQAIKSEDTFLVGYVLFDKKPGHAEVEVVEQARDYLQLKLESGELELPAGVSYSFTGSYENQVRASKKLMVVLPLALFIIFVIIFLQFRSVSTTLLVFSGIIVAWAGGFVMIWCYAQLWFLDFSIFGTSMRHLFQVHPINLSVAIWVGFLALFGIASDDGVIMATYLEQVFKRRNPKSKQEIREAVLTAGTRRVRPCMMTTATTILALIPILTSTGRGSDIMVPMAIPSVGGMLFAVITMFVVPVLYCQVREWGRNGN